MNINPSSKVRKALYVIVALGTPVVAYLRFQNYIGDAEVTLWAGIVSAVSALAGFNVTPDEEV